MTDTDYIIASMGPCETMGFVTMGGRVARGQLGAAITALDREMSAALAAQREADAFREALARLWASAGTGGKNPKRRRPYRYLTDNLKCRKKAV